MAALPKRVVSFAPPGEEKSPVTASHRPVSAPGNPNAGAEPVETESLQSHAGIAGGLNNVTPSPRAEQSAHEGAPEHSLSHANEKVGPGHLDDMMQSTLIRSYGDRKPSDTPALKEMRSSVLFSNLAGADPSQSEAAEIPASLLNSSFQLGVAPSTHKGTSAGKNSRGSSSNHKKQLRASTGTVPPSGAGQQATSTSNSSTRGTDSMAPDATMLQMEAAQAKADAHATELSFTEFRKSFEPVRVSVHKKKRCAFAKMVKLQSFDGGGGGPVWAMKFSFRGNMLATGAKDGILRVFNVKDERITPTLYKYVDEEEQSVRHYCGHARDIVDLAWTSSDFVVTAGLDMKVMVWYAAIPPQQNSGHFSALRILQHPDLVTCVSVHPLDETVLMTGCANGKAYMWKITKQSIKKSRPASSDHEAITAASPVSPPDGRDDMSAMAPGVGKRSAEGMLLTSSVETENVVTACSFTTDGSCALVGTANGHVKLCKVQDDMSGEWKLRHTTELEIRSRRIRKQSHFNKISGITNHPTNTQAVMIASNDSRLRMLSLDDKSITWKLANHENSRSRFAASFSPGEGRFVMCGSEPRSIRIWDTFIWSVLTGSAADLTIFKTKRTVLGSKALHAKSESIDRKSERRTSADSIPAGSSAAETPQQVADFQSFTSSALSAGVAPSFSKAPSQAELKGRYESFETFKCTATSEFAASDKGARLTVALFAPFPGLPSPANVIALATGPEEIRAAAGLTVLCATTSGVVTVFRNLY
ncbi:putative WD repeat-containing protein [Porphyridium purpureum]|uniref:Putative WD repeat-containing protein n=1 Tax=Porphyridium purpureum TaxID=35688 RepID=A0A5J4YT38_PORPP|nr:putative WD repeat-containing protein [Porphyridium purpureum]|eukprot:POR9227..scf236_6